MDASVRLPSPFQRNMEVLVPPGATCVRTTGRTTDRREVQRVRDLPAGAIVLVWGPSRSSREFAERAEVTIDREFLPLPRLRAPLYMVENAAESIDYFRSTLLTLPPGSTWFGPLGEALIALARAGRRSSLLALIVRGRVLVGRRR
jgi:hypothetical protein